ncbi:LysR family transcriptional regulator [uncultured Vibrio sp.]|uniref:LysR family transcriptional regulator n=1 Tax=uncultured Vibrio sp. TaxID=114054 RepID=UPI0025DFB5F3|nr:LysR family transcriptional regulator [uncultured Vibrio sp.]
MQIHSQEVLFFVEVSKYKSFSQAAEQLNIPQPTVSRRIISLERTIKRQLFIRSKSGLRLTPFGEQFRHNALRVKTELNNLKKFANSTVSVSNIKVEALPALSWHLIHHILPSFQRTFPDVVIDLHDINMDTQMNASESIRLQTLTPENLNRVYFPYLRSNCGYYASKQLFSEYNNIESPMDLVREKIPLIHITGDTFTKNPLVGMSQPALNVDNALSAADAIINNIGVSWNYQVIMQKYIDNGEALKLFSHQASDYSHAYISYPSNKSLSIEEEAFVDFVRQHSRAAIAHSTV